VIGLVAVTPAAGFIAPRASLVLGGLSALPSYFAILWRVRTRLDDSLDVVAAHGVGGVVGALLTGVFARKVWGAPSDGLLYGNPAQLGVQALAVLASIAWSALGTAVILKALAALVPLRALVRDEGLGLDVSQHGEEAYARDEGAVLILHEHGAHAEGILATSPEPVRG